MIGSARTISITSCLWSAECLRRSPEDVVALPNLQSNLREQFGLSLPPNAIGTVLKRASRRGYVRAESGVYYRNEDKLEGLKF